MWSGLHALQHRMQRQHPVRPCLAAPGPEPGQRHFFTRLRAHLTAGYIPPHFDNESAARPTYRHVAELCKQEICRTHRPTGANNYIWLEADAGQVPLAPDSADGLLSLEAMFHFRIRKGFLAEAARLLRPGSRMICGDIVFDQPTDDQSAEGPGVVLDEYTPWPDPVTTCTQIVAAAGGVGLQLTEARDIARAVAHGWDCISRVNDSPVRSRVAAMRALQKSGFLHYVVMTFTKSLAPETDGKTQPVDLSERLGN